MNGAGEIIGAQGLAQLSEVANKWQFGLGEFAEIACSGERGQVVARSESLNGRDQFLLRYKAADGRAVEAWWSGDALRHMSDADFAALSESIGSVVRADFEKGLGK